MNFVRKHLSLISSLFNAIPITFLWGGGGGGGGGGLKLIKRTCCFASHSTSTWFDIKLYTSAIQSYTYKTNINHKESRNLNVVIVSLLGNSTTEVW